jgi:hypothetical protein
VLVLWERYKPGTSEYKAKTILLAPACAVWFSVVKLEVNYKFQPNNNIADHL